MASADTTWISVRILLDRSISQCGAWTDVSHGQIQIICLQRERLQLVSLAGQCGEGEKARAGRWTDGLTEVYVRQRLDMTHPLQTCSNPGGTKQEVTEVLSLNHRHTGTHCSFPRGCAESHSIEQYLCNG